ncbi:MaoC family dehydratase [Stakelama tenebrarum]|uniref:MaoC family dehydratase n=1 Tax=Stakelama tenebrarum TaxID=2711215 RepID=A0A6G6Y8Z7_9SPHN|nr:MaoC family dehydratase [Sphingosinithalassobacter tenebrarum]QIG81321.1 MaoC family dehydratase [Sphingosinithalassobacter tenebrarum]
METVTIAELAQRTETQRVSDWVEVSQEMIDKFADATGDHQFIHVDPERAAQTQFGGTIAHGFLTLSLMGMLAEKSGEPAIEGLKMGINYGGNKVRFLTPVRSGKRVRGRFTTRKLVERKPGVWERVTEYVLEIEDEEKPALIAEWITLIYV